MRVWILTVGEPLPVFDQNPRLFRTGLLARALSARGHAVVWWTSTFDHYGKRHRSERDTLTRWDGGEIRLLRSTGYPTNRSLLRFVEHAGVARKFGAVAPRLPRPDVILASLPTIDLAHQAVRYARSTGVPIVVDVRDLWPDALLSLLPRLLRWPGRIVLSPLARKARITLRNTNAIVAVSPGYLEWGLRMARRPRSSADQVFPIGYVSTPEVANLGSAARDGLIAKGVDENKTICWYVGSFGRTCDLAPVISAARALELMDSDGVQFVISGDGELGPRWRDLARGLKNVVFTGWIGADEIEWLRRRASIGLQPYAAGAPQGLANKLFEYLSAGLPVVSSLLGENEALLRKHECGLTYPPGDSRACLEKVSELLDNPSGRVAMGLRARAAFEESFDGEKVLERFSAYLEALAATAVHLA
ncbi:MAG: glycosyltransferase WbuB [Gemmatimonadetes bacterium]|nr:glycosyltransferase WbuB [Gemmatimonadota bacterium]